MNKMIAVPACKKHPKYMGERTARICCMLCSSIYMLLHQDALCACEFDMRKACTLDAHMEPGY